MDDVWCSQREAARRLGLNSSTVSVWCRDGLVRVRTTGRGRYGASVSLDDVRRLAELRTPGAGAHRRRDLIRALAVE